MCLTNAIKNYHEQRIIKKGWPKNAKKKKLNIKRELRFFPFRGILFDDTLNKTANILYSADN